MGAFQKAIALMAEDRKASRSTDAYRGLAIAYVGLGRFKEAIAVLEKAVREVPQDGGARAALADAHLAMGDLDGAIVEAEKRLQLEPTSEARLELAALYARKRVSATTRNAPGVNSTLVILAVSGHTFMSAGEP